MDRDRSENVVDPVERETPSSGDSDTGEVGAEAARIMKGRREKGTEPERAHKPVQTKKTPKP